MIEPRVCPPHLAGLTLSSSTSKMTVPRVSPSPLAIRVGLKMVVYNRCRSENCRNIPPPDKRQGADEVTRGWGGGGALK
eukprot:3823296-Pyramimonas_sp.AAC.1